jgi:hypothetical protein
MESQSSSSSSAKKSSFRTQIGQLENGDNFLMIETSGTNQLGRRIYEEVIAHRNIKEIHIKFKTQEINQNFN